MGAGISYADADCRSEGPGRGGGVKAAAGGSTRGEAALAVLLAWVAGGVDAAGYLTLFHLFTAHMSGNSVGMGAAIGREDWTEALTRMTPIPFFLAGVAIGTLLVELARRRGVRSTFALVLSFEAMLLAAFMGFGGTLLRRGTLTVEIAAAWQFYVVVALPVLAMGLQSATLRRVGGRAVRTTFVTGMLTNMTEDAVRYLFWLRDHVHGRSRRHAGRVLRVSARQPTLARVVLSSAIWGGYIVGAILDGGAQLSWHLGALVLPLAGLAGIIGIDLVRPIPLGALSAMMAGPAKS